MKRFFYILILIFILLPPVATSFEKPFDTVRLHIPANSNSNYDQAVKHTVKEYFIKNYGKKISELKSSEETIEFMENNSVMIKEDIDTFLNKIGAPYPCEISVKEEYHKKDRLPAGIYPTVRILIGSAKGKNVFFALYPSLSVKEGVTVSFDGKEGIRYKSKIYEIIKKICR